ncbi:MAG: hypothetical protein A2V67_14820 [Deltaproteobacteria bacterium RBG_13_61_14]|nr:MAG: hypothetical protein A2V67_14820 [Deltaproteobacteria bacterium RBG_13_61_14]
MRQEIFPPFKSKWLSAAAGPALLVFAFIALAQWTWRKWPDPLIDFGKELYVAWQLSQGQVLYRDLAHLFGPFSQYLNAAAFRLCGVSLTTLIVLNLLILAGITGLLYRSLAAACDRFTALAASLLFLLLFAFSQYLPAGNLNFVSPYAHETTQGIFLTLLMLSFLWRYQAAPRPSLAAGAGLFFGLAFLTKAEIFVAALAALLSWAALSWLVPPNPGRERIRAFALFGVMALVPAASFFLFFSIHMPAAEALSAVAGAWHFVFKKEITQLDFYRKGIGWDDPLRNFLLMLEMTGWIALVMAATLAGDYALRKSRLPYILGSLLVASGVFALLIGIPLFIPWHEVPRALPLTTLLAGTLFLAQAFGQRGNPETAAKLSFLVVWSVWALALLAKIILNTHLYHYGFYLAMPATLLLVVVLLGWIPAKLKAEVGGGTLFRVLILILLAAAALFYVRITQYYYQNKTLRVGQQGDMILAFNPQFRSWHFRVLQTLTWIEQEIPRDATLVALPDGVMLNYLARRKNPTPYLLFDPVVIRGYGEERVLQALQQSRPDYVILMHKDTREFGVGLFGQDPRYGKDILTWVTRNYRPVALFGREPLSIRDFGLKVFQRQD